MTECPHCHSVKVVLVRATGGYEYLCNLGAPHRLTCSVNKKSRPKAAKKPEVSEPKVETETREMVVKNWGKNRAGELLPYAVGETLEDQFLSVLHYINNKGGS